MDSNQHRDDSKMSETPYTNITGNEIALRVALCDLVQRLKRSEFMCKYLEQCRNELASEVIRLRSNNEQTVKGFANNSINVDHHSSNTQQQLILPGYSSTVQDNKSSGMIKIGTNTIKLDSLTDESWEEISNRLINELKQEMMNVELSDEEEFDSATEQPGSDQAFFETPNDQYNGKDNKVNQMSNVKPINRDANACNDEEQNKMANAEYEVQEQHMAIADAPTKSLASYLLKTSTDSKCETTNVPTTEKQMGNNDLKTYGISNGSEMLKVIEICNSSPEVHRVDLTNLIQAYVNQSKCTNTSEKEASLDLVEKLLHNYNVDLEEITKQVLLNNERLLKLKGKHLRNYFRRHLEQSNSTD